MTQPRVTPRPVDDWDDEVRDAFSALARRRVAGTSTQPRPSSDPVSPIIGIFAWHPALAKSWLSFSQHLADSTLPDRIREIVIVRTSWLRRGEYEWVQHVKFARAVGVSDEEIEALRVGPDAAIWGPLEAAVVRSVDEICSDRYVSGATWNELAMHLERRQLMDLVFTAGAYDFHCMAFNTLGLEIEPGVAGFPEFDAEP